MPVYFQINGHFVLVLIVILQIARGLVSFFSIFLFYYGYSKIINLKLFFQFDSVTAPGDTVLRKSKKQLKAKTALSLGCVGEG